MSDVRQLRWLERSSSEVRAVGWSRAEESARAPGAGGGAAESAIDPRVLAGEREARRAAELDADCSRLELAAARSEAAESARAAAEAREREAEARRALEHEVEAMATRTRELVDCAEREIVRLALAVAERVAGRELTTDPSLVVAWAREAIEGAELGETAAIYVSPDLHERVPVEAWGELGDRVVVDHELPRATCEIHEGARVVTCSERARLSLVAAAVSVDEDREAA